MATAEDAKIAFRILDLDFLDKVDQLETAGFPSDEAASKETMKFRFQNGPTFCVGTWLLSKSSSESPAEDVLLTPENLIGYVIGTCSSADHLEHDSMFQHDPTGTHLCIHSVLTEEQYQGKGFAKKSLLNYIQHIKKNAPQVQRISLLSKASKMRLYQACGFTLIGPSHVVHGSEQWNELTMDLSL